MSSAVKTGLKRREFLQNSLRGFCLAGLAAVAAVVAWRGRQPQSRQLCVSPGVCQGCQLLADCRLPQAEATRRKS